jgi:hypothetical protein
MNIILENFLVNPKFYLKHFDPLDLCRVAPVSKNLNELVNICLQKYELNDLVRFEKHSSNSAICKYCSCSLEDNFNKHVFAASACNDCFRAFYISRTDAKSKYNLNNNNLKNIRFISKYIPIYKRVANYFCEKDVQRLSLLINKGGNEQVYKKTYLSRVTKLEALYKKLNINEDNMDELLINNVISPFQRNGKGGIRSVEYALLRWSEFDKKCLCFVEDSNYLQDSEIRNISLCYSLGELDDILAIEELTGIAYRRRQIFKDLERRRGNTDGIDYNFVDDVPVCSDYIHYGMFNVSEVVDDLLVEIFLKDNTDYHIKQLENDCMTSTSNPNDNIIDLDRNCWSDSNNIKIQCIEKWILANPAIPDYISKWLKEQKYK